MIEVEKKFLLKEQDIARLIEGAEFLGEVVNEDTYYDTSDNKMIMSGDWLRNRNGRFELKNPMVKSGQNEAGGVECYKELTTEVDIANEISLKLESDLNQALEKNGYRSFAKIVTKRKKYKKDGFNIDIDQTDFDHNVVEIELEVADESQIKSAKEKIEKFAKERGLSLDEVHGKMYYFLEKFRPAEFQIMMNSRLSSGGLK